ncbi:MAG TPA: TlpA disulfide reductase family protein [Gammaproteobacteria bacterium]
MKRSFACLMVGVISLWNAANSGELPAKLQPFTADSLQMIEKSRKGQPFFIVLWALDCPPCRKELALLGQFHRRDESLPLVLISTDDANQSREVMAVLEKYALAGVDNWIFADSYMERLRYVIDPHWYGELPRSYFYDRDHTRKAFSGILKEQELKDWLLEIK